VQTNRVHINEFLNAIKGQLILDVRSPAEYEHAHIPGAVSFPLFNNEERAVVGTAYKQESREKAIKIGLDYFGPKMRPMVEKVESLLSDMQGKPPSGSFTGQQIFVYCWRGGMRSGAVSWLLNLYGFKVTTLAGGYKAFRNYVLKTFTRPYRFSILGGFTGSGKTMLLQELKSQGQLVIDLEGLACHKGSAFGSIHMPPQPTQEMFENKLAMELLEMLGETGQDEHFLYPTIWLEDESQRIGNLNIPMHLWENMRTAPVYFLDIPFEQRLEYLIEDYGRGDIQKLMDATLRITKRLGGLETKNTIAYLEEGNIREAFRILLQYYDKLYFKSLHNRQDVKALLNKITCEKVTNTNAQALLNQYQTL
jgi:tRNA 2-selenouridine synthase